MTDEQIRAMAEAAEIAYSEDSGQMFANWKEYIDLMPYLRRFAAAVAAQERARCAGICEDVAGDCDSWEEGEGGAGGRVAAGLCADRIRAALEDSADVRKPPDY